MRTDEQVSVDFLKSIVRYVCLAIIPAALGTLFAEEANDNDFAGIFLIPALLIAVPQLIYSLILSANFLFRKAFKAAVWYFVMAFVGTALAIGPVILVENTSL